MANSSDTVSMLGRVRSLSHHCHVSREQVAARVEATLSFTAMTLCCDIVAGMRSLSLGAMNLSPAAMPLLWFLDFFQPKQRTPPLFLRSPNRRRPRISAEKKMSTADNLPQKQQKQRAVPRAVEHGPLALCSLWMRLNTRRATCGTDFFSSDRTAIPLFPPSPYDIG